MFTIAHCSSFQGKMSSVTSEHINMLMSMIQRVCIGTSSCVNLGEAMYSIDVCVFPVQILKLGLTK
jgi:hypothetical protein